MTKKTRQIPQNGSDATTGRITALIASFMDGATTPAEEQEIYRLMDEQEIMQEQYIKTKKQK